MKHPVPTVYSIQICIHPILTHTEPICIVVRVLAKSRARIDTRQNTRRNKSPVSDFFIVVDSQHVQFMTGWKGYRKIGRSPCMPVVSTFPACHQFKIDTLGGRLQNTRSRPIMAIYRLAFLSGKSPRITDNSVLKYQLLSASSDSIARAHAARHNAVITGWRVCR